MTNSINITESHLKQSKGFCKYNWANPPPHNKAMDFPFSLKAFAKHDFDSPVSQIPLPNWWCFL